MFRLFQTDKLGYYISVLRKNWKDKIWLKYMIIWKMLSPLLFRRNKGVYILREKWDNLILLDACRFDLFREVIKNFDINGELQYRYSRASWTVSFLLENFSNVSKLNDIIYITANPYVNIYFKNLFFKIIPAWDFGWDENLKTVPPNVVYKTALETKLKYPSKKLIIHFIQPHEPFIGFKKIDDNVGISGLRYTALTGKQKTDTSIWRLVEKGMISVDKAICGYIRNLEWVMPYAVKLCKLLPGLNVITSDHGEAFGEKVHPLIPLKVYGHPGNIMIKSLIKVPWFIYRKTDSLNEIEKELIKLKLRNKIKISKII